MQRMLIALGAVLLLVGLAWPWIDKLQLGRLPGDIVVERENVRFYFPITTTIIVSAALSALLWLIRK